MKKTATSIKHKIVWCERGWQPHFYCFCSSERAWNTEMKKRGVSLAYPESDAAVTSFTTKEGKQISMVTVHESMDNLSKYVIAGLLVHEAIHVFQHVVKQMQEENPSIEFEAYSIQAITQELFDAYEATRQKLFRR